MNLLLSESQSAIATAKEVNESTEEQKQILEGTVASISKLIEQIEISVAGINSISTSAEACEESKGVIVDAMTSLSSISEENAAACQETGASMEELKLTGLIFFSIDLIFRPDLGGRLHPRLWSCGDAQESLC